MDDNEYRKKIALFAEGLAVLLLSAEESERDVIINGGFTIDATGHGDRIDFNFKLKRH